MDWIKELSEITDGVFQPEFDTRSGAVIPDTDNIVLKDGAVELEATFLYADLAGSSMLAKHCPWQTTAKVLRAYLECATRLIRIYTGEIKSFDGDRVMGVFVGDMKNTYATRCAREIFYTLEKIIEPKAIARFSSIQKNGLRIRNCIGIDTGTAYAVRAGIRKNNDLIWIGKAPSFAAKLSDIRTYPYSVFVSSRTFAALGTAEKVSGSNSMWEYLDFNFAGETERIYRTKYLKMP